MTPPQKDEPKKEIQLTPEQKTIFEESASRLSLFMAERKRLTELYNEASIAQQYIYRLLGIEPGLVKNYDPKTGILTVANPGKRKKDAG